MAGALERYRQGLPTEGRQRLDRRTAGRLVAIENTTLLREAQVQSDGVVAQAKVRELSHVTREGLTDVALATTWGATLAGGDPFLQDRLNGLVNLLTVSIAEVIADLNDTYCREARR